MSGYAVRNDGKGWRAVDSAADAMADETYRETQPQPIITLASAQAERALVIRSEAATVMESIAAPYLPQERESWDIQLKEADAYTANNATPTPLLLAMATARGITVADLVAKVYENANLYRAAIGEILGKQQGLLDRVYAASTIEAVMEVDFT